MTYFLQNTGCQTACRFFTTSATRRRNDQQLSEKVAKNSLPTLSNYGSNSKLEELHHDHVYAKVAENYTIMSIVAVHPITRTSSDRSSFTTESVTELFEQHSKATSELITDGSKDLNSSVRNLSEPLYPNGPIYNFTVFNINSSYPEVYSPNVSCVEPNEESHNFLSKPILSGIFIAIGFVLLIILLIVSKKYWFCLNLSTRTLYDSSGKEIPDFAAENGHSLTYDSSPVWSTTYKKIYDKRMVAKVLTDELPPQQNTYETLQNQNNYYRGLCRSYSSGSTVINPCLQSRTDLERSRCNSIGSRHSKSDKQKFCNSVYQVPCDFNNHYQCPVHHLGTRSMCSNLTNQDNSLNVCKEYDAVYKQ